MGFAAVSGGALGTGPGNEVVAVFPGPLRASDSSVPPRHSAGPLGTGKGRAAPPENFALRGAYPHECAG